MDEFKQSIYWPLLIFVFIAIAVMFLVLCSFTTTPETPIENQDDLEKWLEQFETAEDWS